MQVNVKTTIEHKNGNMTFKCEPNDIVTIKLRRESRTMERSKAIRWFWDAICMGDNFEVEQGAYGLFDTLVGNTIIENDL